MQMLWKMYILRGYVYIVNKSIQLLSCAKGNMSQHPGRLIHHIESARIYNRCPGKSTQKGIRKYICAKAMQTDSP